MKALSLTKLSILALVLLTVTLSPNLMQEAFATHSISTYVANDPDDGDAVFGAGDTLTITTDVATNATVGAVSVATDVTGNFTFTTNPLGTFTTDWTAEWIDTSNLVITFININNVPVVGTSTVEGAAGNNIGDGSGDEGLSTATSTLSGDFGLFVAVSTNNGGGCSGDCQEPTLGVDNDGKRLVDNGFTYNGKPIDVERYFTPYPLVTVNVGEQNVAEFKIYENLGPDNISHFELAFGLAKGEIMSNSKAVINWDKSWNGIETLTVNDPENVLGDIKVSTSEGNCSEESSQQCLLVKVIHTFRAPLDFNILGTDVWDTDRNAWQNYFNHGIEVVGPSMNPPKEYDGINKGQIYHLTETGKNTAVDEFGNSWSLEYGQWAMDYIPNKKIDKPTMHGIDRNNSYFNMYKYGQYLLAENELNQICPGCLDGSYEEIDNIFSYDFQERVNKLDKPDVKARMLLDSERAQNAMDYILDPILYLKNQ